MTREQFIHQVMVQAAVTQGLDLNYAYARALDAWAIMYPAPAKNVSRDVVVEERILGVLQDGHIVAVGGDTPVRARDVLLQAMRRKYGVAIATGRLHNVLAALKERGLIRISEDGKLIELA